MPGMAQPLPCPDFGWTILKSLQLRQSYSCGVYNEDKEGHCSSPVGEETPGRVSLDTKS